MLQIDVTLFAFVTDCVVLGDELLSAICAVDTVIATPSIIRVSDFPNPKPESISSSSSSTFFSTVLLLCFFSFGIILKLGSRPWRVRLPRLDNVSYDLVLEKAYGAFFREASLPLEFCSSSSLALPESIYKGVELFGGCGG